MATPPSMNVIIWAGSFRSLFIPASFPFRSTGNGGGAPGRRRPRKHERRIERQLGAGGEQKGKGCNSQEAPPGLSGGNTNEGEDSEEEGTEVIGNIIHCKNYKSRLTKENKVVDVRLTYDKGLDRYYGLLDLALKHNIFKQVSTRIELPDGSKTFGKTINNNPEKYFTTEILEQLDQACVKEFKYGDVIEEQIPETPQDDQS